MNLFNSYLCILNDNFNCNWYIIWIMSGNTDFVPGTFFYLDFNRIFLLQSYRLISIFFLNLYRFKNNISFRYTSAGTNCQFASVRRDFLD